MMLTEGERAQLAVMEQELARTDPGLNMDLSGVLDRTPGLLPPWSNPGQRTTVCCGLLLVGLALMVACAVMVRFAGALPAILPLAWTGISLSLAGPSLAIWWPEAPSCRAENGAHPLPGLSRFPRFSPFAHHQRPFSLF